MRVVTALGVSQFASCAHSSPVSLSYSNCEHRVSVFRSGPVPTKSPFLGMLDLVSLPRNHLDTSSEYSLVVLKSISYHPTRLASRYVSVSIEDAAVRVGA